MALAIAIGGGWVLRRPPEARSLPQSKPPALQEVDIVLRHQGAKVAEVHTAQVGVSHDSRYAVFKPKVTATLYDKEQVALRLLHADEIVLDRQTNDLVARGHIEITSSRGDRLVASEARLANAKQVLVFPQGVRMQVAGNDVRASRLTMDLGAQILQLEGGVDIVFRVGGTP